MIESSVRPLNRTEKAQLRREIKLSGEQRKKWLWFSMGALLLVMAIGIPLALGQAKKDFALGNLAFGTLAVYAIVVLWVYVSNTRETNQRLKDHSRALHLDKAEVVSCRSNRVLEILEEEDLPAIYFFEVDENKVLYCEMYKEDVAGGQFPSREFEVSRVTNGEKKLLVMDLKCTGDRLAPDMGLSGQSAREVLAQLALPDENFTLLPNPFSDVTKAFLANRPTRGEK